MIYLDGKAAEIPRLIPTTYLWPGNQLSLDGLVWAPVRAVTQYYKAGAVYVQFMEGSHMAFSPDGLVWAKMTRPSL